MAAVDYFRGILQQQGDSATTFEAAKRRATRRRPLDALTFKKQFDAIFTRRTPTA